MESTRSNFSPSPVALIATPLAESLSKEVPPDEGFPRRAEDHHVAREGQREVLFGARRERLRGGDPGAGPIAVLQPRPQRYGTAPLIARMDDDLQPVAQVPLTDPWRQQHGCLGGSSGQRHSQRLRATRIGQLPLFAPP